MVGVPQPAPLAENTARQDDLPRSTGHPDRGLTPPVMVVANRSSTVNVPTGDGFSVRDNLVPWGPSVGSRSRPGARARQRGGTAERIRASRSCYPAACAGSKPIMTPAGALLIPRVDRSASVAAQHVRERFGRHGQAQSARHRGDACWRGRGTDAKPTEAARRDSAVPGAENPSMVEQLAAQRAHRPDRSTPRFPRGLSRRRSPKRLHRVQGVGHRHTRAHHRRRLLAIQARRC